MSQSLSRRKFIQRSALGGASLAVLAPATASEGGSANERIRVGVIGVGGRGLQLAKVFEGLEGAELACLCEVDARRLDAAADEVRKVRGREVAKVKDLRRILDDKSIDALAIAAPDHWHGPATILGCQAGKHVYVEKPASHNPREGEWMLAVARAQRRVVQVGTQRRADRGFQTAVEKLGKGAIGKLRFARVWYASKRGGIGRGKEMPVPAWLDYGLWQGPAPERGFRDNVVHYNWHWFWHWGTGELGNNGVHGLDLARWGLGVSFPQRVTAIGARYFHADDQETPDTQVVSFDFGDRMIVWEGHSCHGRGLEGTGFGVVFQGESGSLVLLDGQARILDGDGKEVEAWPTRIDDRAHAGDFLACVRSGARPVCDIEEGHASALLCHLGNIAQRCGCVLRCDPASGRIQSGGADDAAALALWGRDYRPGWEPLA